MDSQTTPSSNVMMWTAAKTFAYTINKNSGIPDKKLLFVGKSGFLFECGMNLNKRFGSLF